LADVAGGAEEEDHGGKAEIWKLES